MHIQFKFNCLKLENALIIFPNVYDTNWHSNRKAANAANINMRTITIYLFRKCTSKQAFLSLTRNRYTHAIHTRRSIFHADINLNLNWYADYTEIDVLCVCTHIACFQRMPKTQPTQMDGNIACALLLLCARFSISIWDKFAISMRFIVVFFLLFFFIWHAVEIGFACISKCHTTLDVR